VRKGTFALEEMIFEEVKKKFKGKVLKFAFLILFGFHKREIKIELKNFLIRTN